LLTYAAGLRASAIIWVSENLRPEHRAALDWLNEITREGFAFYGVELELLRVGNSPAAPRFNVVSTPNEFSKEAQEEVSEEPLSENRLTQLSFWTQYREYLEKNSKIIRPQKPSPQYWMYHPIGRSGCNLMSVASFFDSEANRFSGELRAEISLSGKDAKSIFSYLVHEKAGIEAEVGEPMHWYNPAGKQSARIYVRRSADISNREQWPDYFEWLKTKLEVLFHVFAPRIQAIDPTSSITEIGDADEVETAG
jgi:Domain of unknown function (DUF4268)